jgi:hypothetical protein
LQADAATVYSAMVFARIERGAFAVTACKVAPEHENLAHLKLLFSRCHIQYAQPVGAARG